ncbi:MAG: OprD family outer membrane porin [Verrucomicrobiota bacterium]|nr:OprD family outer membrane porin [Verrucomicrobiota bacterium]
MNKKLTKALTLLTVFLTTISLSAEDLLKPVNDLKLGTFSGRLQLLSMQRDGSDASIYKGNTNSTSLALKLDYLSPEFAGLTLGLSYIDSEILASGGGNLDAGKNAGAGTLFNGGFSLLNEVWINLNLEMIGLEKTDIKVGRQVFNLELIRADDIRQKPRSFEAVSVTSKDIENLTLTYLHAERMSDVWVNDERWKFLDINSNPDSTMGEAEANHQTRGLEYIEGVYSKEGLTIALYDMYEHDFMNSIGTRVNLTLTDTTAITVWYLHQNGIQKTDNKAGRNANLYSFSVTQKIGKVTVEPGFMSIAGGNGNTTDEGVRTQIPYGYNHPMANSLMLLSKQWAAGADTYFVKATTKIDKTILYVLASYTDHDNTVLAYDAYEVNVIAKQLLTENLSACVKFGYGARSGKAGTRDSHATDTRLFITYNF